MHGQEGRARGLVHLHEIFPAIRIMFRIPQHAGDFFALDIAKETAHAQTFNEGRHIVFHARQVVWLWRHGVPSLYGLALVTRYCLAEDGRWSLVVGRWQTPSVKCCFRPVDAAWGGWQTTSDQRPTTASLVLNFLFTKTTRQSCFFPKNMWAILPAKSPKNWWRAVSSRPRLCLLLTRRCTPLCSKSWRSKTALTMRSVSFSKRIPTKCKSAAPITRKCSAR